MIANTARALAALALLASASEAQLLEVTQSIYGMD